MRHERLSCFDDSKWFGVAKPIKRKRPIKDNPLIIGWDSEFLAKGGQQELLSIQFATDTTSCLIPVGLPHVADDISPPEGYQHPAKISSDALGDYVLDFLRQYLGYKDEDIPGEIYLVSHFSQAEFSNIENLDSVNLFQANKALSGSFKLGLGDRTIKIYNKDLYGLLPVSLGKVGDSLGINKLSLEGIGGFCEEYLKDNMDLLYRLCPDTFREYAIRDAEICYHAYTRLRQFFIDKYILDILHFNTLPSIASYILRKDYLKDYVTPTKVIQVGVKQWRPIKSNPNNFYDVVQKKDIYNGDLNIRYTALLAYHGARVESFYYGRLEDVDLAYYDVDSLYPSSAMLQPLPVKDTVWHKLPCEDIDLQQKLIQVGEGFIEGEFNFPSDTQYPCLPVEGVRDGILYFPLDGISYTTLSELRLALRLGLSDYKILSGYAFLPGDKEINHPLKQYMVDLHQAKKSVDETCLDYRMYKLLMNAIVGKFIEKVGDKTSLDLIKGGILSHDDYHEANRKLKKSNSVGSLWLPEWASLILGKARSLIGAFVAKGSYMVSTDSVLLPADTDISCDALSDLHSVGSDLKYKFPVSHGVIIKSRLYALNPLEVNPYKRHVARHGVHMKEDDFLDWMRRGYTTKAISDLSYTVKRLVKYDESLRRGKPLNFEYDYLGEIGLEQDGKQKLLSPVTNPFAESSWSVPLTGSEVYNNKLRKKKRKPNSIIKPGRVPRIDTSQIIELYKSGVKQVDIARQFNVSRQRVNQVVRQFKDSDAMPTQGDGASLSIDKSNNYMEGVNYG